MSRGPAAAIAAILTLPLGALGCYGLGDGTMGPDAGSSGEASTASTQTDLPCDVQGILQAYCVRCHAPGSGVDAGVPLVTREDLVAPDPSDSTKSVGGASLLRMQSTTAPMPPAPYPRVSSAVMSTFGSWIGTKAPGSCSAPPTASDPYSSTQQCSSESFWGGGTNGDSHMHPGAACITCHSRRNGPRFTIGGTVFPTADEPTDCNGEGSVTVVITDAAGKSGSYTSNSAGNFQTDDAFTFPIHAKVTQAGRERAMNSSQMTGDCNSCHGSPPLNGAPGRIMAP